MILGIDTMDPTLAGIFFLIAVVLFVVSAVLARPALWACLVAAGLAAFAIPFMWDRFSLA